jgi:tripeptide aminopeptidase
MPYKTSCVERFLRYVTYDTQAVDHPNRDRFPSTEGQLVLLRALAQELRDIGLQDVVMDDYGYVMATVPATTDKVGVPTIGFIAHVDTSPESSGAGVKPLVHRGYQGQDLVLPDDPSIVIKPSEDPLLGSKRGHDIITASGKTLLGSDDKAGVAEIVAAAEYLINHPEIKRGAVRVGFTPDEEIGRGADFFDVARFGAQYAYTMDGGPVGSLECETFSAATMNLSFVGFNTHPGWAKGVMVNSIKVAAAFIDALPPDSLSPETTSGYEGYVHPYTIPSASVDKTTLRVLLRDFTAEGLAQKEASLRALALEVCGRFPGAKAEVEVTHSYENMRVIIDQHPQVIEHARQALRRLDLNPIEVPIRGGTDGSRLSFMGLPCPNVFSGQNQIHSRKEWISAQDMELAVATIIEIVKLWEEDAPTGAARGEQR